MNQWALCCLSQGKALLSATYARYLFSWPLLLQVASTLSRFSCSCERLLLWAASSLSDLFSQLSLLCWQSSAQVSQRTYLSFEIGSFWVLGQLFVEQPKMILCPMLKITSQGLTFSWRKQVDCGGGISCCNVKHWFLWQSLDFADFPKLSNLL